MTTMTNTDPQPAVTAGAVLDRLDALVRTLRSPGGCPWDREQTPGSFLSYFIEEAYELLEAVEEGDGGHVREELGDLFFQLVFIGQMYEDQGAFRLTEALEQIIDKMIRRHPHVFGDETVSSREEQRRRWNAIKAGEKKKKRTAADLLAGVPKSFPALRRAQRVSERAAANGFEWGDTTEALGKLDEEVAELREAVGAGDTAHIMEELGDVLFMTVNIARLHKINTEDAMNAATAKFIRRLGRLEELAVAEGATLAGTPADRLRALWARTKEQGREMD